MKELETLIDHQREKLLQVAQEFVPSIILDDLLQPMDFPELENNPLFRYEEGILAGILMVQTLLNQKKS